MTPTALAFYALEAAPPLVAVGADLVRVRQAETQLLAGATGATFVWQWPRACRVLGLYLDTLQATDADAAACEIRVQRMRENRALVTDGLGPTFASALSLCGTARRYFPLRQRVLDRDRWSITLRNTGLAAIDPRLYFRIADPET